MSQNERKLCKINSSVGSTSFILGQWRFDEQVIDLLVICCVMIIINQLMPNSKVQWRSVNTWIMSCFLACEIRNWPRRWLVEVWFGLSACVCICFYLIVLFKKRKFKLKRYAKNHWLTYLIGGEREGERESESVCV